MTISKGLILSKNETAGLTGDLLKHLIDVRENCPVKVAIRVPVEAVDKFALGHFEDDVFDLESVQSCHGADEDDGCIPH